MTRMLVAKVGGSLFEVPALRQRLLAWREREPDPRVLFVPGGGRAANIVRDWQIEHGLGEAAAHWLAIRTLTLNASFLSELLGIPCIPDLALRAEARTCVLDPWSFCLADQQLEHSWSVTSDSIAARIAASLDAELVLMKSCDRPASQSWEDSSRQGLVDEAFPEIIRETRLGVRWVNLRREVA